MRHPLRALDDAVLPRLPGRRRRGRARGSAALRRRRSPKVGWYTALALVLVLAAVGGALWLSREPIGGQDDPNAVRLVGAPDGTDVAEYTADSRTELRRMASESDSASWALVSLERYLGPVSLAELIGDLPVARAYIRVPMKNAPSQPVGIVVSELPKDLADGMRRTGERKEADAAEYERTAQALAGAGDAESREKAKQYENGARISRTEAKAYARLCTCVYGVVVRADGDELAKLASRPEVRVIDPAPEVAKPERAVFVPLRPEDDQTVD
jgi:hypothetical protein